MIIKNGKIQYCTPSTGGDHGRDENGNVIEDTLEISEAIDCNMQVTNRTYYAGGGEETFTQAVYSIIVEAQPPTGATFVRLTQVDGVDAGEARIINVEPLIAVNAYKITAHASKR